MDYQSIEPFLDQEKRIKLLPAKKGKRIEVLRYLGSKFEINRNYSEKEVNEIIDRWHVFGDYFLLRRELIIAEVLGRTDDGAKYWKKSHSD